MKQKTIPVFQECGEVLQPDEVARAVQLYENWFLEIPADPGCTGSHEDDLDMINRYSLYLSEQQGLLTEEQKEQVYKADKIYYNKYCNNKFTRRLNDEIADFFDWLGDVIE